MIDKFYVDNIEKKRQYLQGEHKLVLDTLYKNAVDEKCVIDCDFIPNICQSMTFTKIKNETNLDIQIVHICLRDLESMGFVINVMLNPYKEYSYAMTWLGLKYMEMEGCRGRM